MMFAPERLLPAFFLHVSVEAKTQSLGDGTA